MPINPFSRIRERVTGIGRGREIIAAAFDPVTPQLSIDGSSPSSNLLIGTSLIDGTHLCLPNSYRDTHIYSIGGSGTGKSCWLKNLIEQDLREGRGTIVVDPHGDLVRDLLPLAAASRQDFYFLDLADHRMLTWNPLQPREGVLVAEQVARIVMAFKRIWKDSFGPRLDEILRNTLSLLIEQGYTLFELRRILKDPDFRDMLLEKTEQDQAKEFFITSFNRWNSKEREMNCESTLNKVSSFLHDPRIGLRLSRPVGALDIHDVVRRGGVLFVNLARGNLVGNANLFGALLLADLEVAFLSRPQDQRQQVAVYLDEFQSYSCPGSLETLLTEGRKFGAALCLAHQTLSQLDPELVSIVLGNARTQVYFRVGRVDAERLAREANDVSAHQEHHQRSPFADYRLVPSIQELWEQAFSRIMTLPPRQALFVLKGVTSEPIPMATLDNTVFPRSDFKYTEDYVALEDLLAAQRQRTRDIDAMLVRRAQPKPKQGRRIKLLE